MVEKIVLFFCHIKIKHPFCVGTKFIIPRIQGLIFAAMAGYDPQQAIPFWQRMSQGSSSNQSDIFSDHPSDAKRIAALQKEMPTALKYYRPQTTYKVGSTGKTSTTKKKTSSKKKTTTRRR